MKYIDTFCGLGGFSYAIHDVLGDKAECVWAIDIDETAAKTFEDNFGVKAHGDIEDYASITLDDIKHNPRIASLPDFDIMFGGFPCQPFSRNGKWFNKNNGVVADTEDRDELFIVLVDILRQKQPKYFVFENVVGLLSMRDSKGEKYFDRLLELLKLAGYKVNYAVLDAADYSVPQQRKRLLFVGIRNDLQQSFEFPKKNPRDLAIEDFLDAAPDAEFLIENLWKNREVLLGFEIGKKGPNHPFSPGTSRAQVLKWLYDNAEKPTTRTGAIESVVVLYGDTPSGLPRQQDKIYSVKGIAPTLGTFSTPCVDAPGGLRQLTPNECRKLQGLPDSIKLPKVKAAAYKLIGNSVSPKMISVVLQNLLKGEVK